MLLALDFGGTKHAAAVITAGERKVAARRLTSNADASTDQNYAIADP